eukprot:115487_1
MKHMTIAAFYRLHHLNLLNIPKISHTLNYITIMFHIIIIILSITDIIYINIFATNYLLPLYTLSFFNCLNTINSYNVYIHCSYLHNVIIFIQINIISNNV